MTPPKGLIFVSYARRDLAHARIVLEALDSLGFPTFFDTRDLDPSADFTAQLEHYIRAAERVVVCVTPDVERADSFVRREIAFAVTVDRQRQQEAPPRRLPITPVLFAGAVLPIQISTWTLLDAGEQPTAQEIARDLSRHFAMPSPAPSHQPTELDQYLERLLVQIASDIEQSVDYMLEPGGRARSELVEGTGGRPVPSLRISPALAALPRTLRHLDPPAAGTPIEEFATIQDAYARYGGRLLLVGAPGSGKTTAMLALARMAAVERLTDRNAPVPVLVQLGQSQHAASPSALVERALAGHPQVARERLLLLFDGLDEMNGPPVREGQSQRDADLDARRAFLETVGREYPSGGMVLTCRVADYEQLKARAPTNGAIEIAELTDAQIEDYLDAAGVNRSTFRDNGAILALARRPLLLALLRVALTEGDAGATAIRTEADVFDAFVAGRFRHEAARGSLPFSETETRRRLSRAAAHQMIARLTAFSPEWKDDPLYGDAEFLAFCLRMHFLQGESRSPRFPHLRMRDFFAVSELWRAFDNVADTDLRALILRDSRLSKQQLMDFEVDSRVDRALESTGTFAIPGLRARALAAVDVELSSPGGGPRWLALLPTPLRFDVWRRTAHGKAMAARHRCTRVLRTIGAPAVPVLLELAAKHPYDGIFDLGWIGGAEGARALLSLMDSGRDDHVIAALAHTGSEEAATYLLDRLRNPASSERRAAAHSLFELRKVNPTPFFTDVTGDPDPLVRFWAAVDAAHRHDFNAAKDVDRDHVLTALADALPTCDGEMLRALKGLRHPHVTQAVCDRLDDELARARGRDDASKPADRAALIEVLRDHADARSVPLLDRALADTAVVRTQATFGDYDRTVGELARDALRSIASEDAHAVLLRLDEKRQQTAEAATRKDTKKTLRKAAATLAETASSRPPRAPAWPALHACAAVGVPVAVTAALIWWPALILGLVGAIILWRLPIPPPGAVLVAPNPSAGVESLATAFGRSTRLLMITGPNARIANPIPGHRLLSVVVLAALAGTAITLSTRADARLLIPYLEAGSLLTLRALSKGRFRTVTAFFTTAVTAQVAPLGIVWLGAFFAGVLSVLLVATKWSPWLSAFGAIGSAKDLEDFAAELDGHPRGLRRWMSTMPSDLYVVRGVDWALSSLVTVAASRSTCIAVDVDSARDSQLQEIVAAPTVPLMVIINEFTDETRCRFVLDLGIPRDNLRLHRMAAPRSLEGLPDHFLRDVSATEAASDSRVSESTVRGVADGDMRRRGATSASG